MYLWYYKAHKGSYQFSAHTSNSMWIRHLLNAQTNHPGYVNTCIVGIYRHVAIES